MYAYLKNYRQSPHKVRLVADAVRGKQVPDALALLAHMPQKSAQALRKLIAAAVAGARADGHDATALFVGHITVDKGTTYRRSLPRAFGRASPMRRTCAHVRVLLSEDFMPRRAARRATSAA